MKKAIAWSAAFCLCTAVTSLGATVILEADLTGAAERPTPVDTPATGFAQVTLDDITGAWSLTGSFSNLKNLSNNAHIHGPAGVEASAGVLFPLTFTNDVLSGSLSGAGVANATQIGYLVNGMTYVNVHSDAHGGGEIRGQLLVVPEPASMVLMGAASLLALRRRRRA